MVPLLLLLLLPKSLAEKDTVCVSLSKNTITINTTSAEIREERHYMTCSITGMFCVVQCRFINKLWFSGSSYCLEADVATSAYGDTTCYSFNYTDCTISLCNKTTIMPMITQFQSDSSDQKDMMQLFHIREFCPDLFSGDLEVKAAFVTVERRMIHEIMQTSQPKPGGSLNYKMKFLAQNVFSISEAELSSAEITARIQKEAPQLLPQNASYVPEVWLPIHALRSIGKERRIISLITYLQGSHFQFRNEKISSMILRIEVLEGHPIKNLITPIKMKFRIDRDRQTTGNETRLKCHYFDEKDFTWETNGCETLSDSSSNHSDIICNCNHATPFAVLLIREPIAEVHWKILSYISYIGCGLSAFFTALSLVMYVFSRHHAKDYSIAIHVSLSGALFLLNVTFLLTEWGVTVEPGWVCVLIAALVHYSLLCCFTWMAIEALHLYLLLIKVFNTYYKHYMVKLSLVGWGLPGVIVAVSLSVKDIKQFYGVTTVTMADTNQTNSICWITDDSFFYSSNLVYFTLIFIFNSGILVTVASSICKMKQVYRSNLKHGADSEGKYPERFRVSCRSGLTVLGLTCLMGTTWGLAFLGSGYVNYPVLYLFCIFNSSQGFCIFLWICLSARKQRMKYMEDRMTSSPVKTLETKTD